MKRTLGILVLISILAGAYFINRRLSSAPHFAENTSGIVTGAPLPVMTGLVRPRSIHQSLELIGSLKALRQVSVSPRIPGKIVSILVQEGQHVHKGQLLVRLDTGDINAQLASARAGVDAAMSLWRKTIEAKHARRIEADSQIAQAKAGLKTAMSKMRQAQMSVDLTSSSAQSDSLRADAAVKQAEAGVQQAEAGVKQADAAARRLKFLYEHGGVARTDMESAQTQAEIAHGSLDAARAALEQSRAAARPARTDVPLRVNISKADLDAANAGVQQAKDALSAAAEGKNSTLSMADRDIQSAQAQLEQAQAALTQAQEQAKSSIIDSPLDGVINGITVQPGDMTQPGAAIMMVTSTGGIYLEAPAPTRYAPALKAGLSADITVDSMPDKTYDGHLLEVMPVAASDNRSLTLRFAFDVQPPHLMPNLSARAMIDLSRTGTALSVQVEALRNDGGNPYVYIVQNGRAVRKNVTLGAIEGDFAEITDGLAQDDVVILSAPSTLQPGALVSPEGR